MFGRTRAAALAAVVVTSLGLVVVGSTPSAVAAKKPPKPVVSKIDPRNGPTSGGTLVTIKGKHLKTATKVLFGKAKGTKLKVKSDKKLKVLAPPHAEGLVDVRVKTKGGKSATSPLARFTYAVTKPQVSSVTPGSGPDTGGTQVTVTGTGFTGVTAVSFSGTPGTAVSVASPTELSVTTPAHDPGVVHISVTNAAGSSPSKSADLFRFVSVPRSIVAPVPPGADLNPRTLLADVTCPSGGACMAVGYYFRSAVPTAIREPLIEQRTGTTTWAATDPGLPGDAGSDPDAQLFELSCPSASFCAAVGSYKRTDGTYAVLVSTWNGASWSSQGVSLAGSGIGATSNPISAIDCPTDTSCYGVGSDYTGVAHEFLVLTLAGGTWSTAVEMPPVGVGPGPMSAISCPAAGSCVAVGSGDNGAGQVPVIATLSSGSWQSTSPALPPTGETAAPNAWLEGVSCTGVGTCTAVGAYLTNDAKYLGMIQQQTVAGWTPLLAGGPAGSRTDPGIGLHAVSCVDGFNCQAVGEYAASDGSVRPLLVTLAPGGGVAPLAGPLPPSAAPDTSVNDVACAGLSACAAVGRHRNGSDFPLLETLVNTAWTAQVGPMPPTFDSGDLEAVAIDPTAAVGVGRLTGPGAVVQGLITVDIPRG